MLLQNAAEYLPVAEDIAAMIAPGLVHKIVPDAWPKVARLATAGTELRDALDRGDFREMVGAARVAQREPDFNAAVVSLEKLVKLAEAHLARIDRLAREVIALVSVLREIPFASVSFVPVAPAADLPGGFSTNPQPAPAAA